MSKTTTCPKCLGSGELVSEDDKIVVEKCFYCNGEGKVNPGDIDDEDIDFQELETNIEDEF